MVLGLALTLTQLLALILAGLLAFTAGFFAAHSIGAGWTGTIPTIGRAQAASLYNLAYYVGSSVIGWAGGLVFQSLGWTPMALAVMALACLAAVTVAVLHPRQEEHRGSVRLRNRKRRNGELNDLPAKGLPLR
jgi:predicted MFS family arabinose efflux permease